MAVSPTWFRWLSWLMAGGFAACVVLQYNDPDPLRWMAVYAAAMVISVLLPVSARVAPYGLVVGVIAAAWSIYLISGVWGQVSLSDITDKMSDKGGAVEEEREAAGLLLEALWLLGASMFRRRRR